VFVLVSFLPPVLSSWTGVSRYEKLAFLTFVKFLQKNLHASPLFISTNKLSVCGPYNTNSSYFISYLITLHVITGLKVFGYVCAFRGIYPQ